MTHEDFNSFQLVDKQISKFLRSLKKHLDDTILIFAGDHGPRFGGFVKTVLGRLEERMPFVSIRVPNALAKKQPHLRKFLTANKNSLVTWYDVHQIMLDVTKGHFSPITGSVHNAHDVRAISIWRELVPASRTCEQANIPEMFCVCDRRVHLDPICSESIAAGKALVDYANKLTRLRTKDGECVKQIFNGTLAASYMLPDISKISGGKDGKVSASKNKSNTLMVENIKIKLRTMPANAIIEGSVVRNRYKDKNTWYVVTNHFDEVGKGRFEENLINSVCNKL